MRRYYLDTNVLIRFLTHDDETQAGKADNLFQRAAVGDVMLVLTEVVIVEAVWVLTSAYAIDRWRIADTLGRLIIKPGILCDNRDIILDALARFANSRVDIVDCSLASHAATTGQGVATFDADFEQFKDIKRWEWDSLDSSI